MPNIYRIIANNRPVFITIQFDVALNSFGRYTHDYNTVELHVSLCRNGTRIKEKIIKSFIKNQTT